VRLWASLLVLLFIVALPAFAAEPSKRDAAVPHRTDSANEHLPWYKLEPGVFPPRGSEHRVGGTLVAADFIHRTGQFRTDGRGELVNFSLPSFGTVLYLNTEGDFRDVPLGTHFSFALYQDEQGQATRAATMEDDFTVLTRQGLSYRLEKFGNERATTSAGKSADVGKSAIIFRLEVVKQNPARKELDLGHAELLVNAATEIHPDHPTKGGERISEAKLAVGDALLVNLTAGAKGHDNVCSEIWAGAEAQKLATETERTRHKAFVKERGLAAVIDSVEGKKVTVTLLGAPATLEALFKDEGIDPAQWAKERRFIRCVVANDELRTYNPPVDGQGSTIVEFQSVPTQGFGCGGVRWVIEPSLLLEGFRKGRIVRLFVQPSWPVHDMPFGESLYTEMPGIMAGLEEPKQFPYRTDLVNEQLPWYRLKTAEFPPLRSQHTTSGELLKVDALHRTGQFRTDRTGKLVDFTMPPYGSVTYLNAPAQLGDLPLGTRYHFFLYQDDRGDFSRAALILDEFSRLLDSRLSYRIESLNLAEHQLVLASQQAKIRNDKDFLVRPPDVGRGEFTVNDKTRVWKDGKQIALGDLAVGDELLINETGRTLSDNGYCTEIWVGENGFEQVTAQRREKNHDLVKQRGFAGWISHVAGKELTLAFFTGPGEEYNTLFHDGPVGGKLKVVLADNSLIPSDPAGIELKFKSSDYGETRTGRYGYRGTSWTVEADKLWKDCRLGQAVLVFDPKWAKK
jgi:hypothetical protein